MDEPLGSKVPIPNRVSQKNRRFQKGMLIPANTKIAEDGTALFGQVDSKFVEEAWNNRICQLCGKQIAKRDWCVFVGGMRLWRFEEAPLHIGCARYSMLVCPHLVKAREKIGVSVCKTYDVQRCEPPEFYDPGCIPTWDSLRELDKSILVVAHKNISEQKDVCNDCGCRNAGQMSYSEFVEWAKGFSN